MPTVELKPVRRKSDKIGDETVVFRRRGRVALQLGVFLDRKEFVTRGSRVAERLGHEEDGRLIPLGFSLRSHPRCNTIRLVKCWKRQCGECRVELTFAPLETTRHD